jgi:hypothetical protein
MNTALHVDERLFDGGPPLGLERKLGLMRSSSDQRFRRALIAALFSWAPLAVLTVMREFGSGVPVGRSLLEDVAVHVRYLISVPLFILAEGDTIPRFSRIACHFFSSGVVGEKDWPRYSAAVDSTRRLLNSRAIEILLFLLAYVLVIVLVLVARIRELPAWQVDIAGPLGFSVAGLWHVFVSLPMLMILFVGWMWRIFLWWRFTTLISRIDLNLIPAHPDQFGGLRFVSISIRGYRLLAVAISSIVAGSEANLSLRTGQPYFGFKDAMIAVIVFIVVLSAGPLFMFLRNLRATKTQGIFKYGSLGREVGLEFERKWLVSSVKCDSSTLKVADFSTMTDLYQVVGNVYQMKQVPLTWNSLNPIIVATALPFVPVALMAVPFKELLSNVVKLLL